MTSGTGNSEPATGQENRTYSEITVSPGIVAVLAICVIAYAVEGWFGVGMVLLVSLAVHLVLALAAAYVETFW